MVTTQHIKKQWNVALKFKAKIQSLEQDIFSMGEQRAKLSALVKSKAQELSIARKKLLEVLS